MTLRKLLLTTALPLAFALAGCGPTTTTGGTQTKVTDAKGNPVTVDEKLSINSPVGFVSPFGMKQGESKQLEFSLTRGKDLKDDVELMVDSPDKVKVEVPKMVPAAGDGKFLVKVTVMDDAAVAEHPIKLTAKSGKGTPATSEFKVKADKK